MGGVGLEGGGWAAADVREVKLARGWEELRTALLVQGKARDGISDNNGEDHGVHPPPRFRASQRSLPPPLPLFVCELGFTSKMGQAGGPSKENCSTSGTPSNPNFL